MSYHDLEGGKRPERPSVDLDDMTNARGLTARPDLQGSGTCESRDIQAQTRAEKIWVSGPMWSVNQCQELRGPQSSVHVTAV